MTCIVGIAEAGRVYLGGDSAGVAGYSTEVRSDAKVFRTGPYVMGFTTSFRMGQLLHHRFEAPLPPKRNLERFMVTTFIDAVSEVFEGGGWLSTESGRKSGGTFLVGVSGRLFSIYDDFQVGECADKYASVGCGMDLALGSLHSTKGQQPTKRIRSALTAAAHHSAGVSAPFVTLSTKA